MEFNEYLINSDQIIDKSPISLFLKMSHYFHQHLIYFYFIQYFHLLKAINYDTAEKRRVQILIFPTNDIKIAGS